MNTQSFAPFKLVFIEDGNRIIIILKIRIKSEYTMADAPAFSEALTAAILADAEETYNAWKTTSTEE